MKKILLFVLVALVAVALVACGGETTTTEGTTTTAATTTAANTTATTTVGGTTTTEDPGEGEVVTPPATGDFYSEGINIISGEVGYMAIDAFKMSGRACTFENWHPVKGSNWHLVFSMYDVEEMLNEQLFDLTTVEGRAIPYEEDFTWILYIDDQPMEITSFYNSIKSGFIWVRLDLGADWTFVEGLHEYDIKVQILDKATQEVLYCAWLTDPDLAGPYAFEEPAPTQMVEDPNGSYDPNTEVKLEAGAGKEVFALTGPEGSNSSELYGNVLDGSVDSKLCTRDMTANVVFQISDDLWKETIQVTSFSIVGANDDASAKANCRVLSKFKIYGAYDSGDADADWQLVLSVDKRDNFGEIVNYGERHYKLDNAVNYKYYMLVVEDVQADEKSEIYQLSEILVFVAKD